MLLIRQLILKNVCSKNIFIIIDYIAYKNLINRYIMNEFNLKNVRVVIIDDFQNEKNSIVIFNIIDNERIDFLRNFKRLLNVVNRTRDDFIIFCN